MPGGVPEPFPMRYLTGTDSSHIANDLRRRGESCPHTRVRGRQARPTFPLVPVSTGNVSPPSHFSPTVEPPPRYSAPRPCRETSRRFRLWGSLFWYGETGGDQGRHGSEVPGVLPHLDERQRRLAIGAEARSLGHGGIRLVAVAAGVREGTVSRGAAELKSGRALLGRVRRPGRGRKKAVDLDPGLRPTLLALVEPDERGGPMSPLLWPTKLTRTLAAELYPAGPRGLRRHGRLLRGEDFSLQANTKTSEGAQHPARDAQFRYLNEQARDHRDAGDPVISDGQEEGADRRLHEHRVPMAARRTACLPAPGSDQNTAQHGQPRPFPAPSQHGKKRRARP